MDIWRQGGVLNTPDTMRMPYEDRLKLDAQESCEIYRNFSAADGGRSRARVAVFNDPADVVRTVAAVNACRWRKATKEPFPTDNARYPIQIWGPGFHGVSLAWFNNDEELGGATMWCEMAPLPEDAKS